MKTNVYTDAIMGEWKQDKEASKKKHGKLVYRRQATVKIHKDNALDRTDPETYKAQKVHGEVILKETKHVDRETSKIDLFKELELTDDSVVINVI